MIVIDRVCVSVPPPIVLTWIVKLYVPAVIGAPEITLVTGSSDRPTGSDPDDIDHLKGKTLPEVATVCE